MKNTIVKTTRKSTAAHRAKKDKLPKKLESFIHSFTAAIEAAAKVPGSSVNLMDYLDAAQIRTLGRLAAKDGKTPRQFVQSLVHRLTASAVRELKGQTLNVGGAA